MKHHIIRLLLVLLPLGFAASSSAQDDPVLMDVAGSKVTRSEFLNIYQKNNVKGEAIDKKSLDEYVELFINFKLKVREAEELGLDTLTSFKNELGGYRKQLAQNYLVDNEVNDELMKQAYERMQHDVRASHILIKCEPGASPRDTLAAWTKISDIRKRILAGESFEALAKELSDDPSAKDREAMGNRPPIKGNGGDLGYFTVFDMVYPFENAAYKTSVGQISNPIRTDYGYHIIKVTDFKKAMGKAKVAHIYLAFPQNGNRDDSLRVKNRIKEAHEKLNQGIPFDTVCLQYSEDKGTAPKGGVLPWFGVNRMVPEFITSVSKLSKPGDISEPITTPFGWHIVKLLEKKEIGTFEESKADIKQKVSKDTRSQISKEAVINKIKKQYGYTENPAARDQFTPLIDSTFFKGTWDVSRASGLKSQLFSIGARTYTQEDFAAYLAKDQHPKTSEDAGVMIRDLYKKWTDEACLNYKDSRLEQEFPDFRNLMKEYRDGILLFDLTDQKVWTKAMKDTTGLDSFHRQNKANYMWGQRVDASVYKCLSKERLEKAYKLASKALKKNYDETRILEKVNGKDSVNLMRIDRSKFSKGDFKVVDKVTWEKGIYPPDFADPQWMFVVIHQVLEPEPKTLSEARGLVTADYQNFLEKEWIRTLRAKYPVEVYKEVLSTIK